jgi:hypothetical protein
MTRSVLFRRPVFIVIFSLFLLVLFSFTYFLNTRENYYKIKLQEVQMQLEKQIDQEKNMDLVKIKRGLFWRKQKFLDLSCLQWYGCHKLLKMLLNLKSEKIILEKIRLIPDTDGIESKGSGVFIENDYIQARLLFNDIKRSLEFMEFSEFDFIDFRQKKISKDQFFGFSFKGKIPIQ